MQAADTFNRAVHISHVNYGPHNLEQVEVLESLAETYLAAGEFDLAVDMQERIFGLQARNVDPESLEILPALRTQARWLNRLRLYDRERYTWRRIISILEEEHGRDDLSLIEPLTGLGQSYLYVGTPEVTYHQPTANTTGEIYLKRALRIAEEHPDASWETEMSTMLSLADYYILTSKPGRAERVYSDVWALLSEDEDRLPARREKLQSLKVLQDVQPPRFYGIEDTGVVPARRPEGFETGTVTYSYSVSERGTPTNIQLVEANPAVLDDMERAVGRELRRRMQRPQVVDGMTVQTDNLTYSHDFFYRDSDLPESTAATGNVPD
ncbi:MAG: tetratricopeptide repeat protein [Woeseiaceae bacterium]|nr:tetratricopeptide repeat protein [Woeseiaceae bacterium]